MAMATRALVYEEELLSRLRKDIASSAEFRIASGLMTMTDVPLLTDAMGRALRGGRRGEVLAGLDLPTHPDALELPLQLARRVSRTSFAQDGQDTADGGGTLSRCPTAAYAKLDMQNHCCPNWTGLNRAL
jgi:hypothetical protein